MKHEDCAICTSSSRGLANSWHSSITDSSQTTIPFPPRPNACLSWFCSIKMSKLLQLTLWAGAATYKTCSAHHNLSSLSHICTSTCVCVYMLHMYVLYINIRANLNIVYDLYNHICTHVPVPVYMKQVS